MKRVDVTSNNLDNIQIQTTPGTTYVVKTGANTYYKFGINNLSFPYYSKSTNNGVTWEAQVVLNSTAGFVASLISIWYEPWSGISSTYIHIGYGATDATNRGFYHRRLDTSNDSLSTQVQVYAAAATASRPWASLTVSRGGNIYAYFLNKTTVTIAGDFKVSTDGGANWTSKTLPYGTTSQQFAQFVLLPSWNNDNQDIMLVHLYDSGTTNLTRNLYDASGNTWGGNTTIMSSLVAFGSYVGNYKFAATVDLANSRNLVVSWNRYDTATALLKCFTVTESTITAVTDVVASSTDDQGFCAIAIDTATGAWYVFYCGNTAGTETFPTSMKVYYKYSTDQGSTWSAELPITTQLNEILYLTCTPQFTNNFLTQDGRMLGADVSATNRIETVISAPFPLPGGTIDT